MTAEAIVMNKSAVAIAADSAVTISSGRQGMKTFDTVNKLFELIKGSNIAAMVFANAEINGVPWETVIKTYRGERVGFRAPYVEDYVEDFQSFIGASQYLLAPQSDLQTVTDAAYSQLLRVFEAVRARADEFLSGRGRIVKARVKLVLDEALDQVENRTTRQKNAPWSGELSDDKLHAAYGSAVDDLISDLFKHFPVTATQSTRLRALVYEAIRKCITEPGETGLVMAGFGDRDYFPKLYSATIRGRISGVLRVAHPQVLDINSTRSGHFQTFAQDEQAWGFLSGITNEVRQSVIGFWQEWVNICGPLAIDQLGEAVPRLGNSSRAKVAALYQQLTHSAFDAFLEEMQRRQQAFYIQPMLRSIAVLPKNELGLLAESLVNLTSLKQKMSIYDAETVGGAIDVAMVSPGDGFVWLRRKHYFSSELNPGWHVPRQGTIRDMSSKVGAENDE